MRIRQVHVKNFRCIRDEVLDCEDLTALVGPNGSGKSTFLHAIDLFYASSPRITPEDFYNRNIEDDIEIAITFSDLCSEALQRFGPYVDRGVLTVIRILSLRDGRLFARFYGCRLQNPTFRAVRSAPNKTEARRIYNELRQREEYHDLPTAASADAALTALKEWEENHLDSCTLERDQGQFFGFSEVGQGYLGDFTHFILIPAVRDAIEEGVEGKGSAITELMDLVVRHALTRSDDLAAFETEAQKQYDELIQGERTKSLLQNLEGTLERTLQTYAPTAGINIQWQTGGGVSVTMPRADVRLLEDEYPCQVGRAGHGLQRALVITMLQHLVSARVMGSGNGEQGRQTVFEGQTTAQTPLTGETCLLPNLIIGIEEPELYQHPSRQRHLAKVLLQLAQGSIPGVAESTQVIYATHSPLFVGIDRFDQLRIVRKVVNGDGLPKTSRVTRTDADTIAKLLWEACDRKDKDGRDIPMFTGETLRSRLQCLMTPWMSEAFFADVVVLVEGEGDRAAILGAALVIDLDFESMGIAVIPCGGKPSIDRPALIFRRLGIPTYVVWDGDKGDKNGLHANRILQRILGCEPVDWPTGIGDDHACFESKLERQLREELGEVFSEGLQACKKEFGYRDIKHAIKNPNVLRAILARAENQGIRPPSLEKMVDSIMCLYKNHIRGAD